jgi:hypothetical protein
MHSSNLWTGNVNFILNKQHSSPLWAIDAFKIKKKA